MNNTYTIEKYQDQYGKYNISLSNELLDGFKQIKIGLHQVVDKSVKSIKGPNLIMKVMRTAIKALMYIPKLTAHLGRTKSLLKEIKDFTNVINGLQSIDGLINFKFSWKLTTLNVSGLVLFVLSIINLSEKFLIDCTTIKTAFTAIPVFGVLPFGGLLHISIIGLFGSLMSLSLNKRKKQEQTAHKINNKIDFWKNSIDLNKISIRNLKYEVKILNLQKNLALKEKKLTDGKEAEKNSGMLISKKLLVVHQKSLEVLQDDINKNKQELSKLEKKKHQWGCLGKNFKEINVEQLQDYQKAKEHKWKNKFDKLNIEKKSNLLTINNNIIGITKQLIIVATVITGIGLTILPFALLGFGIISSAISITNYFMKKSIDEIKINPVNMKHYLQLVS